MKRLFLLFAILVLPLSIEAQVGSRRLVAGTPASVCKPGSGDVYIDTSVTPPDFVSCDATNNYGKKSVGKVNTQTGTSYTVLKADRGKLVTFNNGSAVAVTLPQATSTGSFLSGWSSFIYNLGAGTVTVTPTTSTINGGATLTFAQGEGGIIFSDGTNYSALKSSVGTGGPPTGSAGGDLGTNYPNPTVVKASGEFALSGSISPSQVTSNQNDYSPTGFATASVVRISTDASRDFTGLAAPAVAGTVKILHNIGSFNAVLKNQNAGSTAANRIASGADVTIGPDQSVAIQYDGTSSRWRVVASPGSTGGVTNIATTSPITGGPITGTGTIACATCVTSSSPGAGIAHFAGSTQAVTSSPVVETDLTLADNTTNNSSTSNHGFLKKLSNVSTEFMNGQGNWATPAGGSSTFAGGGFEQWKMLGLEVNGSAQSQMGIAATLGEYSPGGAGFIPDLDSHWRTLNTDTSANTDGGFDWNTGDLVYPGHLPQAFHKMKTFTVITSLRYWIGFFGASPMGSSDPTANAIGFSYDTGADGSVVWYTYTNDNSGGGTRSATAVTVSTSTIYLFAIVVKASSVEFYISTDLGATYTLVNTHTTNLPASTATMNWYSVVRTLNTTQKKYLHSYTIIRQH